MPALTNTSVSMVDLPFHELCNQAPVATQALGGICAQEGGSNRYIYYMSGSVFNRYDAYADTWQLLATPSVAPLTILNMSYTGNRGFHGRVISATSTTIQIPGLRGKVLDGTTLRIERGTGIGQEKTITFVGETVHDAGVITGTTTLALTDSTKKWKFNQWAGYMVGITFGTDATQYKKCLYNDATTLYFSDANLQPHDPWNNAPFVAAAPYALPVTTAGLQAHYQIMSSTFSVSAWDVIPDATSFFTTLTGGIYMISSAAGAPFFTFQYYDVAHDSWQSKTVPQSLILAALATDVTIDRAARNQVLTNKQGAVSGTARTLTDAGQALTPGTYANHRLHITGGTGIGQSRRIVAHNATTFTVGESWEVNPDSTSTYEVRVDTDRVWMMGGAAAAMLAYSPARDWWMQGHIFDNGITNNISCTMNGWLPLGVTSGARIASGIRTINSAPTAGGTGYTIGDILTCSVGGVGAQVIVTSVAPGGVVTGLELVHSGTTTGFTVSTGNATTGGTGTGCTINITAVGATALITTATAHWFRNGQSVTFAGCTEAAWNAAHTIIGVNSTTSFSVSITATANMAATASQSTTTIVDPTQNWVVNEHVGRLVHICVAGTAPTSQIRWITANTATTLTFAAITAAVNGTSKYAIYDAKVFGVDDQRKETGMSGYGYATGGSTTTLIDSSKSWIPNQWAGYVFKVEAGTGYGSGRISIISNTATTLTYSAQGFTPDATTRYEIADTWGLLTSGAASTATEATTKNWVTNQWAGKRMRFTGGTLQGTESAISANTATALTITGTPDATSAYAILAVPPRGAGIELIWVWGSSVPADKGRRMYAPRGGGSNTFDIYDITTGRWTFGTFFSPQAEPYNTGSSYGYDGVDSLFMSRSALNLPIRIQKLNTLTGEVDNSSTTTFLQNAVHVGNYMEILSNPDGGLLFSYIMQNTGTLMSRAILMPGT